MTDKPTEYDVDGLFEDPREQALYSSVLHGLRSQGWSREDAEDEAWAKITKLRKDT